MRNELGLEVPLKSDELGIHIETQGRTLGQNRSFWLLKRFLIFQGISGDLDVNLSKHITMKMVLHIKRYFKFVL